MWIHYETWKALYQNILILPVGSSHSGTVVRLTKFGAFVKLAEGIDGLIHISKLGGGRRINHPKEVLEEGQTVEVKIEEANAEEKRLSLALVSDEPEQDTDDADKTEAYQKYMQKSVPSPEKKDSIGTLGDILRAKLKEKEEKR